MRLCRAAHVQLLAARCCAPLYLSVSITCIPQSDAALLQATPLARRPSEEGSGKPKSDAEMPEAMKVLRKRFSGSFVDPMHKTPSEVGKPYVQSNSCGWVGLGKWWKLACHTGPRLCTAP